MVFKKIIMYIEGYFKVGVVGRIGFGKLSIVFVFLCMFEVEGLIIVDGVEFISLNL